MTDSLLAGTLEAPGEYFKTVDRKGASGSTTDRYFRNENDKLKVAQGVSKSMVDKETVLKFLLYLQFDVKHGYQNTDARFIAKLMCVFIMLERLKREFSILGSNIVCNYG